MERITEEELIGLTGELVSYESTNPPGNEQSIAEFIADRLSSSPVEFSITTAEAKPDRPNVTARAGDPSGGTVLLIGHVDVVPADSNEWSRDPFALHRDGDRLIGRGTSDMKGALAAKILAAESYLSENDLGEVVLAFVVGEETTGFGTETLVDKGIEVDAAILGEPTDLQVGIAQKGVVRYDLMISGESAHSGWPEQGISAIAGVRELLVGFDEWDSEIRSVEHPLLTPGSISVTEVESGTAPNIIPNSATMTVDWRSVPGASETSPTDYDSRVAAIVEAAENAVPGLEIEYERWVFASPAEVDPKSTIAEAVQSSAREANASADLIGFNATTDARHLIHAGVPTVLFGPGSIEDDAHSVDESITVSDLQVTARAYRGALDRMLR